MNTTILETAEHIKDKHYHNAHFSWAAVTFLSLDSYYINLENTSRAISSIGYDDERVSPIVLDYSSDNIMSSFDAVLNKIYEIIIVGEVVILSRAYYYYLTDWAV
jgi:hypothetical protein